MTDRRSFLRGTVGLGTLAVAGCLGGGGEGEEGSPGTTDDGDVLTPTPFGPDENERSLPSELRIVSAVGTNVADRRIGTVEVTVATVQGVEEIDLTKVTADWTVPADTYELAAAAGKATADGYFGIEPEGGGAGDATLEDEDERYRLVFDLGRDDAESDDRPRRGQPTVEHFGSVLQNGEAVRLRLRTAGSATTNVILLTPEDVTAIEGPVQLTVEPT
ncbi:hypothetical protein [Halorientalis halophila]|uniref:hypothetical protein n=1 Tax=Halorientalis halophila TaxID=3108499 RepID=UPI00300BAEA0